MHWYGSTWPMGLMMVGWPLLAGLVVGAVVWLIVGWDRPDAADGARRVLAERYARGELDTDEYRSRLAALR